MNRMLLKLSSYKKKLKFSLQNNGWLYNGIKKIIILLGRTTYRDIPVIS